MRDPFAHLSEVTKHVVDGLSMATVIGTLANMLPSIAAGFSIVWTAIRIYETRTVQRMIQRARGADPDQSS